MKHTDTTARKVVISERALFARVSRKLAREGEFLHRCRLSSRWFGDNGAYYTVNDRNAISSQHIDLDAWAREMGALKPFEALAE